MYRNATTMRKMKPNRSWPSISKWCGHWFASLVWLLGWFPPIADQRKGRVSDLIGETDGDSSRTPPADGNGERLSTRRALECGTGRESEFRAEPGTPPRERANDDALPVTSSMTERKVGC